MNSNFRSRWWNWLYIYAPIVIQLPKTYSTITLFLTKISLFCGKNVLLVLFVLYLIRKSGYYIWCQTYSCLLKEYPCSLHNNWGHIIVFLFLQNSIYLSLLYYITDPFYKITPKTYILLSILFFIEHHHRDYVSVTGYF